MDNVFDGACRIYTRTIPNLRIVNLAKGWTWASGRPDLTAGLSLIKSVGARSVIDLETTDIEKERNACATMSLEYISRPFPALEVFDVPSLDKIDEVLAIVEQKSPVLIHCQHGSDRTGMIIGCFRSKEGWPLNWIMQEMKEFGHSGLEIGYTKAVEQFYKRLHSN